jgi:putative membrane protein
MMWNGSWGWWGPGLIFMIFCMVMMVWMMSHGHHPHRDQSQRHTPDEAERILGERLARGEIDTEEYERRLAALHQTSAIDRT